MPQGLPDRSPRCWLVAAGLLCLAWAMPTRALAQGPSFPCPGNRLTNPGFEEGFGARGGLDRTVARGWLAWQDASSRQLQLLPASLSREGAEAAQSGAWSQALRDLGPLQAGGLWQRVEVPAGERLSVHAWARSWAGRASDRDLSRPGGRYALSIGVDPRGGSDPAADGIAWTAPITITDTWLPFFLESQSEAGAVSLFLRGQPLDAVSNEARWDEACLRLADLPLPPPPSATPEPRATAERSEGEPSETPSLPTLEARARGQAAATGRAIALQVRATERAATPASPGLDRPALPRGDLARAVPLPPALSASGPDHAAWWLRAFDLTGLVALALAALALGLLAGLGRTDRGAGS